MAVVQEQVQCCDRCGEREGTRNFWTSHDLFHGDLCKNCIKAGKLLLDIWLKSFNEPFDEHFIAGQQYALTSMIETAMQLLELPSLSQPLEHLELMEDPSATKTNTGEN